MCVYMCVCMCMCVCGEIAEKVESFFFNCVVQIHNVLASLGICPLSKHAVTFAPSSRLSVSV